MNSEVLRGPFTAGDIEHLGALALGATMVVVGLTHRSWAGAGLAVLGGAVMARGAYGYKRLRPLVGQDGPGEPTHLSLRAIKIEEHVVINRSPEELYEFWRNLENLPQVMSHLVSVKDLGGNRSRWIAEAPAGTVVEWDAELINDLPSELIAWRSLEGSDVDNAGSVHFRPHPSGGTEVKVVIRYTPPGDVLGAAVAKFFGVDPQKQVKEDLARFKEQMEKTTV
jgi:uncharacterized membrane protein